MSDPHSSSNNDLCARKKNLNIDNCLECFCLKVKRPTHSNQTGKEGGRRGGRGVITLPCSRSYTEIDGGHNDFSAKKQNDYLNLKEEEKEARKLVERGRKEGS